MVGTMVGGGAVTVGSGTPVVVVGSVGASGDVQLAMSSRQTVSSAAMPRLVDVMGLPQHAGSFFVAGEYDFARRVQP